jgi:hypothetical protein
MRVGWNAACTAITQSSRKQDEFVNKKIKIAKLKKYFSEGEYLTKILKILF